MQRYEGKDVAFSVPGDWEDRTVTAFAAPASPGRKVTPNVVVTRDRAEGRDSAATYADRQLVELAKKLDGFSLVSRHELTLDGLPAVEMTFTWSSGSGKLQNRQVFVVLPNGTALSITATVLKNEFDEFEPTFDQILESFEFPADALE
jgi:hypothetical protein